MIARTRSRRGLTAVAVLALLLVLGMIATTLVSLSASYRSRSRVRERAMQSEALADAGLDRAFARLAVDPKYAGETWAIPPAALGLAATAGNEPAAVVAIAVEDEGGTRVVRVRADHPVQPDRRARASRRVVLTD